MPALNAVNKNLPLLMPLNSIKNLLPDVNLHGSNVSLATDRNRDIFNFTRREEFEMIRDLWRSTINNQSKSSWPSVKRTTLISDREILVHVLDIREIEIARFYPAELSTTVDQTLVQNGMCNKDNFASLCRRPSW